jgi:hypothetical protein
MGAGVAFSHMADYPSIICTLLSGVCLQDCTVIQKVSQTAIQSLDDKSAHLTLSLSTKLITGKNEPKISYSFNKKRTVTPKRSYLFSFIIL